MHTAIGIARQSPVGFFGIGRLDQITAVIPFNPLGNGIQLQRHLGNAVIGGQVGSGGDELFNQRLFVHQQTATERGQQQKHQRAQAQPAMPAQQ